MTVVERLRKVLEELPTERAGTLAIAFLARELDVLHGLDEVRVWQIKDLQRRLDEYEGIDVEIDEGE